MTLIALGLVACSFEETVREGDFAGTLVVPAAAATRTVYTATGEEDAAGNPIYAEEEVKDARNIGAVFVGLYSEMDNTSYSYPAPAIGPVVGTVDGDAYPYGGTSVGRYDFACYEMLACNVVTGRFTDYDDLLDYFKNNLLNPVTQDGTEITSGEAFQQACYDYYYATTDEEMAFIGDLDFSENADGDFEASFTLNHSLGINGAYVWAWMDAPIINQNSPSINPGFTTCDTTIGRDVEDYNHAFTEGAAPIDLLNRPSDYVSVGDWVSDGSTTLQISEAGAQTEDLVVTLSTQVTTL